MDIILDNDTLLAQLQTLRSVRPEQTPKQQGKSATPADGGFKPLLLAKKWDNQADVVGWWVSEKLDGMRAYWDGVGTLFSRAGNKVHAPDWFLASLPPIDMDGELTMGRGTFQETISIVRSARPDERWRKVQFHVFDSPSSSGGFEARVEQLSDAVKRAGQDYLALVEQVRAKSMGAVTKELDRVLGLGGEGLMLRQPGSGYEGKRSSTLLKVKRMHDMEARVVAHEPGKGRNSGRLGALVCELQAEPYERFKIGSGFSDAQREDPPPVGSLVTFCYQELTNRGAPRFPTFLRVAPDPS